MRRTVSLKLDLSREQSQKLLETQLAFSEACNAIVPFVVNNRCWNRVALHHFCYYEVRKSVSSLGSQMVCNALRKVCASYKTLRPKKHAIVPTINYRKTTSVHYCARTFSLKEEAISLFTIHGRLHCRFITGQFQLGLLEQGSPKEAELVRQNGKWFLNLVLDLPDKPAQKNKNILAVDLGENNLAVTSKGTIHGGGKLRHERDRFLARRKKLQSNGSKASKRCLVKISGKEKRHVKQTNHLVSKSIVQEAKRCGAGTIVLEDLTHIRKRIQGNKRIRSRLHRWSWYQLQQFIEYKAKAEGIEILYVNPAYTSQTCSFCFSLGLREKNHFKCLNCGSYQHSDRNAAINLLKPSSLLSRQWHQSMCQW